MIKDKNAYNILVVEDNPGDFVIVEELLEEQILHPSITNAVSFKQAKIKLAELPNGYDAIFLDLSLPDKSGDSLVTQMLELAGNVPIVILTGNTDIDFSVKSISLGILDYLVKDDLTANFLYKSLLYSIERKRLNVALIESEKRYSDLFHFSPQPMWLLDAKSLQFLQVNKAATDLYGYTEEEFLTLNLTDIKAEDDFFKLENFTQTGFLPRRFNGTVKHRTKAGGLLEMDVSTTPMMHNDREIRSVIALDVTEKKLYEHKITKAIIKTQEDERYEIGGELHDNVCQILVASQLYLGMLKEGIAPHRLDMFQECNNNINKALDEIRYISHRLAPAFFDESTLDEAFKRLFRDFLIEKKHLIHLNFDESVKKYPISLEIQLNLYRILQEQLSNILKYAQASLIQVDVFIEEVNLTMMIKDNGIGFHKKQDQDGIGMANMKRRAELFEGNFDVKSAPQQGCIVTVKIPLPQVG